MNIEEFINETKKLGIDVTGEQLEKLEIYCNFLLEYNTHTNLTAIKNREEVYLKHFYDSLTLVKSIDLTSIENLLDIGTGAGFPGIVLKIFFPNLQIYLVDSNNKKTKFLNELKNKLNVDKVEVINNRIENITSRFINSIDVVTARAVTNLPVLVELALPLVKVNKYFIAMKGNAQEELEDSEYAITYLGGKIEDVKEFDLPHDAGKRMLITIQKTQKSELNKLRPYEKIVKKPLQK